MQWIGIIKKTVNSAFYQVTTSGDPEPVDDNSNFWFSGEPNGSPTDIELCSLVSYTSFKLFDAPCNFFFSSKRSM